MMRLEEFDKPDYSKMSEEELTKLLDEGLVRLSNAIDRANEKVENEQRRTNPRSLSSLPQA